MKRINFNNDWKFCSQYEAGMEEVNYNDSAFEVVRLPHSVVETPYNYFDEGIYQKVAVYRKVLVLPENMEGERVFIEFGAVGHSAMVYVNGVFAGSHKGGYTAFEIELTSFIPEGEKEVLISVICDSRESQNIPPFGKVIDYMTFGGMYREVYINIRSQEYIKDVFVMTEIEPTVLKAEIELDFGKYDINDIEKKEVERYSEQTADAKKKDASEEEFGLEEEESDNLVKQPDALEIKKFDISKADYSAMAELVDKNGNTVFKVKAPIVRKTIYLKRAVENVALWSVENPELYRLIVKLFRDDEEIDEKVVRFGFREAKFTKNGFYLNGKKVKLVGLNRHQSYPYVGYAMPKSIQETEATILKNELCVNAVRTSHYTQSQHFIDKCDELGLLVFTELPGWQFVGDEEWKNIACESVAEMVKQYRNHPSIIIWGVRINESGDDDEFYERTNKIAHSLDRTRATGGVRCFKNSHLLEDVYTYNDFSHVGNNPGVEKKSVVTSDDNKPYLISEYGGHMYPTKAFDDEEHRMSHAARHAKVINDMLGENDIAGCFGWCMSDYNTHRDFGSGDRICYHGVLDMFRNPKPAAYVYASQGEQTPILHVTSSVEIGDHPECTVGDFYVMTNADRVRLYKNDQMIKEYTRMDSPFTNMPHPPILINDRVGNLLEVNEGLSHDVAEVVKELLFAMLKYGANNLPLSYKMKRSAVMSKAKLTEKRLNELYNTYVGNWGDLATTYKFEAVKNGEVVATVRKQPMMSTQLLIKTDKTILSEEDTYDAASIRIEATDENGNRLYYCNAPVVFETEGEIEIIGPKVASLIAGSVGTYVKTTGKAGSGVLKITALGKTYTVDFDSK